MSTGAYVAIVAVLVAVAFGLWRRRVDGRFRAERPVEEDTMTTESVLAGTPWQDELGERATLLQFSSAFCAPCRTTRVVLADVAAGQPGVVHVEVDAEKHLDVVRRLQVIRTPTTLVLDGYGRERVRAAGVPIKEQVVNSLPT